MRLATLKACQCCHHAVCLLRGAGLLTWVLEHGTCTTMVPEATPATKLVACFFDVTNAVFLPHAPAFFLPFLREHICVRQDYPCILRVEINLYGINCMKPLQQIITDMLHVTFLLLAYCILLRPYIAYPGEISKRSTASSMF